jgi:Lrp/AsnC family transcriptional regulator, regulator for asnA, asnC and gidA
MSHDLDPVDRQIIAILQQDGRTSNVEIARRTGVSEATVRKRLDRLLSESVIRISAVPDAAKVGFSTVTFLTFSVELSQLDRIADQLARLPQIRSIYYTTGENDLIVEAWFPSSDDLLCFLTKHVAAISGIRRTATSHVLRNIKDSSTWVLPTAVAPRVLVVDDDPDFLEIARLVLTAAGMDVSCALCGEDGLASMRVNKPDLVVVDIMMRGMLDGLRMGREMRTDGDLQTVPILMVSSITGSAFASLLPKDEDLPADNFMTKPVDPASLVAEVRRLLRVPAA